MIRSWRHWGWIATVFGAFILTTLGCDSNSQVEIPEQPTEAPAAPPSSTLPPPPPPQY